MSRRQRGSALLLSIAAIAIVAIAAQAVHGILMRGLQGFQAERRAVQLRSLTDAALATTLARLSENPSVRQVARQTLGGGYIESAIRKVEPGLVEVLATAHAGRHRGSIRAVVSLEPAGPRVVTWEPSAVAALVVR